MSYRWALSDGRWLSWDESCGVLPFSSNPWWPLLKHQVSVHPHLPRDIPLLLYPSRAKVHPGPARLFLHRCNLEYVQEDLYPFHSGHKNCSWSAPARLSVPFPSLFPHLPIWTDSKSLYWPCLHTAQSLEPARRAWRLLFCNIINTSHTPLELYPELDSHCWEKGRISGPWVCSNQPLKQTSSTGICVLTWTQDWTDKISGTRTAKAMEQWFLRRYTCLPFQFLR